MSVIYLKYYDSASLTVKEQTAAEHRIGRELLQSGLEELYQLVIPSENLEDHLVRSELGKPSLKDHPELFFSISHTDDLVICSFADVPVGADAEKERRFVEAILRRTLSPKESEFFHAASDTPEHRREWFFRYWTLKEAYVKMTGSGVTVPLTDVSFSFSGTGDPFRITCSDPEVSCYQLRLGSGHYVSVCTQGPDKDVRLLFRQ